MTENRFVNLIQGSPEWKFWRKGKIGASFAPSIMGVGFRTPRQLFFDIIHEREVPDSLAMERGRRLEEEARKYLNEKYGWNLITPVVRHPTLPWHFSSLDGLYISPIGNIFAVEIKCPGQEDHGKARQGKIPEKYIPQLDHIFEDIPEIQRILYLSYSEESQYEITYFRNESQLSIQLEKEKQFYENLINCQPPSYTKDDWIDIEDMEAQRLASKYQELKMEYDQIEGQMEEIKLRLSSYFIEGFPKAQIGKLKMQRISRMGSIDYSKIEALKGLDLETFRKPCVESIRLSYEE